MLDAGTSTICAFAFAAQGEKCSAGTTAGSCPSSGLVGCCILTSGDGGSVQVGNCYYDSAVAAEWEKLCVAPGESWSTTAP
jgi:hypothetical protein